MEKQLYFENIDDTFCCELQTFIEDAKIEELKEITLVEAIPDNSNPDYVWCTYHGECIEKSECKKSECSLYSSKSGRGVCEHRGKLYRHGDEVKFDVETSNQIT